MAKKKILPHDDPYVTIAQVARQLSVSRQAVHAWTTSGRKGRRLPTIRRYGRVVVHRVDLARFLKDTKAKA